MVSLKGDRLDAVTVFFVTIIEFNLRSFPFFFLCLCPIFYGSLFIRNNLSTAVSKKRNHKMLNILSSLPANHEPVIVP